ncbi:hypothetical protein AYI95_08255 [Shewanella xiamenensis]|nr:hypothetical protein AYI95_08255 [Shewanella xiamenensis]
MGYSLFDLRAYTRAKALLRLSSCCLCGWVYESDIGEALLAWGLTRGKILTVRGLVQAYDLEQVIE